MDDRGLTITGGSGGVTAHLEDLLEAARLLDLEGDAARDSAGRLAGDLLEGSLAEAVVLCPVEVASAEAALLEAGALATALGVELEAVATLVELSAEAYRELDERLARLQEAGWFAAGMGGGLLLPVLVGGGVAAGGTVLLLNPALAALLVAHREEIAASLADGTQDSLYDHPWLQELLTRSAPGAVQGAGVTLAGGDLALLQWLTGGHWPTSDYGDSISGLIALGNRAGWFLDAGDFAVTREQDLDWQDVRWGRDDLLASVVASQRDLEGPGTPRVRVLTVTAADGSTAYVVQIPGTKDWNPARGDNPADLTTNLHLMAQADPTRMQAAVRAAMAAAGVPPGAPVMLSGHSQGGITAASLAADPDFRLAYDVRSVVTAGSPIARFDIPPEVSVLSLEHRQDLVPKLDGRDNPDLPHWITVVRDLPPAPSGADPLVAGHDMTGYTDTALAADASDDPRLDRWRDGLAPFVGGTVTGGDYELGPRG